MERANSGKEGEFVERYNFGGVRHQRLQQHSRGERASHGDRFLLQRWWKSEKKERRNSPHVFHHCFDSPESAAA